MKLEIFRYILFAVLISSCSGNLESQTILDSQSSESAGETTQLTATPVNNQTEPTTEAAWPTGPDPLQIEVMRQQTYTSSPITIEQMLNPGTNYNCYLVSYLSEGFKIYALMTVPMGAKPDTGWPVIIFNHGYINPPDYRTTENYVSYMDMLARSGYIVFKSDFRGHGDSEGKIVGGGYGSSGYTTDVLNAMESLKNFEDADPNRFGMWGHSMGGQVTLRAMVVSDEINAGVIWAGAVAPYPEIITQWSRSSRISEFISNTLPDKNEDNRTTQGWHESFGSWVQDFTDTYGTSNENPDFWATISPNAYLDDVSGPIQIHHGTADHMVPLEWSETLVQGLEEANKTYEFYAYEGDDHNISGSYREAMQRTIAFFDQYVKGNLSSPISLK